MITISLSLRAVIAALPKRGEIILVRVPDFFDETMNSWYNVESAF